MFLQGYTRTSVNHSPYSADLEPSDFHLFGPLKKQARPSVDTRSSKQPSACGFTGGRKRSMTLAYKNLCHIGGTNVSMCRGAMWRNKERVWLSNVYQTFSLRRTVSAQKIY